MSTLKIFDFLMSTLKIVHDMKRFSLKMSMEQQQTPKCSISTEFHCENVESNPFLRKVDETALPRGKRSVVKTSHQLY